ncbi:MAG: HD domain-containing protein [bacterium]|nr:HD domain-containing protein [bacterium]
MKFSDIFKKKEPVKETQKEASITETKKEEVKLIVHETKTDAELEQELNQQKLDAYNFYGKFLEKTKHVYSNLIKNATLDINIDELKKYIETLLQLHEQNNSQIIALTIKATPELYIYGHITNLTILSTKLSTFMHYKKLDSLIIGLAAFLHDLGMCKLAAIMQKPDKLTDEERKYIHMHPEKTVKLIDQLDFPEKEIVKEIVIQVHERIDGSGYPKKMKDVLEPAQILGITDTYEALSHPRAWRGRYSTHEAIKWILENGDTLFSEKVLRAFLEMMSLYPPGTLVKLNTGEIGIITSTTPKLPTRPQVKLLIDPEGNKIKEPKFLNLTMTPMIYVLEAVDEQKLKIKDQKLKLELKAMKWWIKTKEEV